MTGPEHYRKAEQLARQAAHHLTEDDRDMRIAEIAMGIGQVHATLALAAATAYPAIVAYTGDDMSAESRGWANATAPAAVPS